MLEKFKVENKRKKTIIIFTILCVFLIGGIFLSQSFALFETSEQFNIVTGTTENPGDITFAFYINDEIVLEAPKKDSGLALDEKSNCTNGVHVSWNMETWNAKLDYSSYKQENTSKVKCNLYFHNAEFSDYVTSCGQNSTSAAECMKKYAGLDTVNLAYDETTDNNLRYIGADPNNYVWFNEELWRMIGVMEQIDDGTGKKETRIKLIRAESIGVYSYDSSAFEINEGNGINEWSESDLNELLNDFYYNGKSAQICYNGSNNTYTSCSFEKIGLTEKSKNLIASAIWTLSANRAGTYSEINASAFYQYEREDNPRKICTAITPACNDTVGNVIKWNSPIGLMYPSDFGYAASEKKCYQLDLFYWYNYPECYKNDWIPRVEEYCLHTMTPAATNYNGGSTKAVWCLGWKGHIPMGNASNATPIFPVLYLKPDIRIIEGRGTLEQPYKLLEK